ncbi:hypothetical protein P4123_16915 [Pseudomonas aeruginosa]|nr:hypothetical protein [Pseudomonas aeruginosa]
MHAQARSEPLILDLRGNPEAGTVLDEQSANAASIAIRCNSPGCSCSPRSSARTAWTWCSASTMRSSTAGAWPT